MLDAPCGAVPYTPAMERADHVLVVDDDAEIRKLLGEYLERNGFRVSLATDGAEMQRVLDRSRPDIVVLDLMLPGKSGLALCRDLRAESNLPVIMLTARGEEVDRIVGLEMGADDYLAKPFSPRELLARLRAILRRRRLDLRQQRVEGLRAYRFGGWELNLNTRQLVSPNARHAVLTNGEFSLLVALLAARGRILSRAQLLELSRLHGDEVYDRAVDVLIMRLRRKFGEDSTNARCILTIRGAGYRVGTSVESVY